MSQTDLLEEDFDMEEVNETSENEPKKRGRKPKDKKKERVDFDYNEIHGYDKFKNAKTLSEQLKAFEDIEKEYNKPLTRERSRQGYYLRLMIDIIRGEVPVIDPWMIDYASKKLLQLITGITKSMLRKLSMSINSNEFDETVNTVIDEIFIKVVNEYDPIYRMYICNPPVSIVSFSEHNRKYALSEYAAAKSGNSTQNYKVDQRVKKAIRSLDLRGIENPSIQEIIKEMERIKYERSNKEFLNSDDYSTNISIEVVKRSLDRINFFDNQSSLYVGDHIAPNIELKEGDSSEDFIRPESSVVKDETQKSLIDALHVIEDYEGVQMYLLANGLTESDDKLYIIPECKVKNIAEKFNTSVIETKKKIHTIQATLSKIIKTEAQKDKDVKMSGIDRILSQVEIPFIEHDDAFKEVEDDLLSIIEITDF